MVKKKELTEQQLALLNESYPVSEDSSRLQLPRFGMLSKDITESSGTGKNKKIVIVQSSGTFYTEKDEGDVDEDTGKKKWTKKFIDGETIDVQVIYHRRQLRMFDSSLNKFYSTPIFDNKDQTIPLYLDKKVVHRMKQEALQAQFPTTTEKGKLSSKLKEDTILFVIYEGELYQMNLSQSSGFEFKNYKRSVNPSTVVTTLGSKEDKHGDNIYRKVIFKNKRMIDGDEFEMVNEQQTLIKDQVKNDERFYLEAPKEYQGDKELEEMANDAAKALK